MNQNLVELLSALEQSYKGKYLEGLVEGEEYFEETSLQNEYSAWKDLTKHILHKLKNIAKNNELFEANDEIQEILDNWK